MQKHQPSGNQMVFVKKNKKKLIRDFGMKIFVNHEESPHENERKKADVHDF